MKPVGWFAWCITIFVLLCMLAPLVVVIGSSFNVGAEVAFPPKGFSFKWYANAFARARFIKSLEFTLLLASACTAVSLVLGLLSAAAIVRYRFLGREVASTLLSSPLIAPQVVLGMSLLIFLSQLGVVSSVLGLSVLHLILTLPYTVRVLMASLVHFPISLEEAAVIHGASRVVAFTRVTVPVIKPGIVAAAVFAFVTSFDNFTASQFLIWDRTTLPIEIFAYATTESDPTVCAISAILVVATTAVVILIERWVGLETFTG